LSPDSTRANLEKDRTIEPARLASESLVFSECLHAAFTIAFDFELHVMLSSLGFIFYS
jgi:hypothetical protein